jgi:hypothetical protein
VGCVVVSESHFLLRIYFSFSWFSILFFPFFFSLKKKVFFISIYIFFSSFCFFFSSHSQFQYIWIGFNLAKIDGYVECIYWLNVSVGWLFLYIFSSRVSCLCVVDIWCLWISTISPSIKSFTLHQIYNNFHTLTNKRKKSMEKLFNWKKRSFFFFFSFLLHTITVAFFLSFFAWFMGRMKSQFFFENEKNIYKFFFPLKFFRKLKIIFYKTFFLFSANTRKSSGRQKTSLIFQREMKNKSVIWSLLHFLYVILYVFSCFLCFPIFQFTTLA